MRQVSATQDAGDAGRSKYRAPSDFTALASSEAFEATLGPHLGRAPSTIFVAGDSSLLLAPLRVAIVGAREASPEGRRRAAKLATQLAAEGVVVVSGLAAGIDRAAHGAAILAGGRTIAVLGTPLDRCYPAVHARIQEEIYRDHLLVSQFGPGSRVFASNFPARNRTMAMLAHASVVVEAGDSSGSISQAAEVQRLGRPLFIMRSVAENPQLSWPASFLKTGARILDDVSQLLSALADGTTSRPGGVQQLPLCDVTEG